ncbi:hypothetical protein EEX84_10840 [Planococcus salinus]|uniref:Uncharacterized protein n=1 Tax=Planococcus salinus TaxID=1848460 RepID=A0A3M8P676_9BACL|nr:hypothetical protein EEX84_10840 [Planococcus salinus]
MTIGGRGFQRDQYIYEKELVALSELLSSKRFVPVYFIVGCLSVLLFRALGSSWLEVFMSTFLCFLAGILLLMQNFTSSKETENDK